MIGSHHARSALLLVLLASSAGTAHAADYYVRADGNDAAAGTADGTAWRSLAKVSSTVFAPGDRIFFRRGDIFAGQLVITSSGTSGAPIVYGAYGAGDRPVISGTVNNPYPANSAIYGINREYVTVRDFTVTHIQPQTYGITFFITLPGVYDNVTVSNNNVSGFGGGGIYFNNEASTAARFNNAVVEFNTIQNLGLSTWVGSKGIQQRVAANSSVGNDPGAAWRSTNSMIRFNTLLDIQADGIVWRNETGGRLHHNVVGRTGLNKLRPYAGLWIKYADASYIDHNESFGNTDNGFDGQAFDLDLNTDFSFVQYNFSYDNEGGFILFCPDDASDGVTDINTGNVVRYNISENDRLRSFRLVCGRTDSSQIYNNTIYASSAVGLPFAVSSTTNGSGNIFRNNIFAIYGASPSYQTPGISYLGNLYNGHSSWPSDASGVFLAPKLLAANTGEPANYRLQTTSPAINAGQSITGNGGFDFFGTALYQGGFPEIGAYEGAGLSGLEANVLYGRPVWYNSGNWAGDRFENLNNGSTALEAWTEGSADSWLQWHFAKPKTLTRVRFHQDNSGVNQLASFRVRYFSGGTWTYLNNWTAASTAGWQTYDFPDVANVERIQLWFRPEAGGEIGVTEVEAYGL